MYLYDYFSFKKIKMMSLIFDGILLLPKQSIDIFDIENYLYSKSGIKMKISVKPFKNYFTKFGEANVDIKEFKKNYENKCFVNQKVIHHNHMIKENNIIAYICTNCNLKIKHTKELIVLFHNSKGYDNAYMIDIFSKIKDIKINCLAENIIFRCFLIFSKHSSKNNIVLLSKLYFLVKYFLRL